MPSLLHPVTIAVAIAATPLVLGAQQSPSAPPSFDVSRLVPGTDSLAVFVIRGVDTTETGRIVDKLRVEEVGGRGQLHRVYSTRDQLLGVRLDSLTDDLATLEPIRHRSRTHSGAEFLEFADGRAVGTLYLASGDSIIVDVPLTPGIVNSSSFDLALRAAPLAEGWRAEIPAFLPNARVTVMLQARVSGVEVVQGMRCWKVDAEFTGMPVTFWVAQKDRRLCQQVMQIRPDLSILFAPIRPATVRPRAT